MQPEVGLEPHTAGEEELAGISSEMGQSNGCCANISLASHLDSQKPHFAPSLSSLGGDSSKSSGEGSKRLKKEVHVRPGTLDKDSSGP